MIPAALELLMRRLQVRDRKALHGAAMVSAELWNSAGMHLDREKLPHGVSAKEFLPELPEERMHREAEEQAERVRPINKEQFNAFKEGLLALTKKKTP
jgi:hypothetical protein